MQIEKEIQNLETNLSDRQSKLSKLREEAKELNASIGDIIKEGTALELQEKQFRNDIRIQGSDLENAENLQKELRLKYTASELKMKNINIESSKIEIETKDKMIGNEAELNSLSEQKISLESKYKILRTLLHDKYITNQYYDVCKVLNAPGINNLDAVIRSSGVSPESAKATLEELDKNGIVEFNGLTGSFRVTSDFDLEEL